MLKKLTTLLIISSLIVSCENKKNQAENHSKEEFSLPQKLSIRELLSKAQEKDKFGYYDLTNYFLSGYFFNTNQKHAIIILDSTIEIYLLKDSYWMKVFSDKTDISVPGGVFRDMNFDSKVDFLASRFVNNSFSMTYGHLFLYKNDSTFYKVPEADTIPNLQTASNSQLKGEYAITCKENGTKTMLNKYFRWNGDKIEYIKTETTCLPE